MRWDLDNNKKTVPTHTNNGSRINAPPPLGQLPPEELLPYNVRAENCTLNIF